MTPKERMMAYFKEDKTVEMCVNCKNFRKHYVYEKAKDRYEEIITGHCILKQMRARNTYDLCEHFTRLTE